MRVEVLLTPRDIAGRKIEDRSVVVFDVLRATTTMTAALAAGVREIRVFDSLDAAVEAAKSYSIGPKLLCGERNCLPPAGFDLGNSPGAFQADKQQGFVVFMSTTNGTRAITAAKSAKALLIGAIVNATAVAQRLVVGGNDVALLCAGTNGDPAMEDLLGAGAVIDALAHRVRIEMNSDIAQMAARLFASCRSDLRSAMADAAGGRNVLAVGLGADIDFAARLDAVSVVGQVVDGVVRPMV